MRSLKYLRTICIFLLFLPLGKLVAQPVSPVDQTNLSQFMDELQLYYGNQIQIAPGQIEAFVQSFLPLSGATNCLPPEAVIDYMTPTSIGFDWAAIPSAIQYKAGFLSLFNGNNGVGLTNGLHYDFLGLPDGLYLFAFQTECANGMSKVNIIIIDKVVHLELDDRLPCDCKTETEEALEPDGTIDLLSYYALDITLKDNEVETHRIHLKRQESEEVSSSVGFDINPWCGRQGISVGGNIFYPLDSDGETTESQFHFAFDNGFYYLDQSEGFPFSIYLSICKDKPRVNHSAQLRTAHSNAAIQAFPNPVNDRLNLQIPTDLNVHTIALISPAGHLLKQVKLDNEATAGMLSLNTASIPSGLFFIKIIGLDFTETWKFYRKNN